MPHPEIDGVKNSDAAFAYFVIFRILLGAAFYHAVMCLALLGVNDAEDRRSIIQDGMWPIKVLLIGGCCYGAFQISTVKIWQLFYLALTGAALSTLIQALLLVDVAYEYAQWLVELYEETYSNFYKYLLIGITVALNIALAAGSIYLLIKYPSSGDQTITLINILTAMTMTILSATEYVQEINPQAGIFQASLLGCYSVYLIASAIVSRPSNEGVSTEAWIKTLSSLGFFFAMFFTAFSALRTGQASHKFLSDVSAEGSEPDEYNRSFFHFIFFLAALQLAVVMNRWRVPSIDAHVLEVLDSNVSYVVKVGTSWVIFLLYMWSLFAPQLFPDRDFF